MLEINEKLTRQIAHLGRLELTDAEVQLFTPQLGQILAYVEQLQTVDVEGVEPLSCPIALETPFREDEARPSPVDPEGQPKVLSSASDVVEGGFRVPQIL